MDADNFIKSITRSNPTPLTMQQYLAILEVVKGHLLNGRRIKYVRCNYDNRTYDIYRVVFQSWGGEEIIFTCVNKTLNSEKIKHDNMYDEILEWLSDAAV